MKKNVLITCSQAKEIDLVIYLSSLGYEPSKIRGNHYWYFSPFRNEKTPSFKVNRQINRWYDFGEGVGGSIIDFGIRYYHCSIAEFLNSFLAGLQIPKQCPISIPVQKPLEPALIVDKVQPLSAISLVKYLDARKVKVNLAKAYLKQIYYTSAGRQFYGLGFKNNRGGWEIRSAGFKGSAAPKYITHLNNGSESIQVFEGFMDFLSFLQLNSGINKFQSSDYLILNSVAMVSHAIPILKTYPFVHLYLDNNPAGEKATLLIKEELPRAKDNRSQFTGYSDLNEFLCGKGLSGWNPP